MIKMTAIDKSQITKPKQIQTSNTQSSKQYDLEERTLKFAKEVIEFVKNLRNNPPSPSGRELEGGGIEFSPSPSLSLQGRGILRGLI